MNRSLDFKLVLFSLPLTLLFVLDTSEFPDLGRCKILSSFKSTKVVAQPIIPEPNSTNTVTNQQGRCREMGQIYFIVSPSLMSSLDKLPTFYQTILFRIF